jgi:hypothetical protein
MSKGESSVSDKAANLNSASCGSVFNPNRTEGESGPMASWIARVVVAGVFASGMSNAIGAEMFAFPKDGQSQEQQQADKQYCESWAGQQTGSASGSPAAESTPSEERMGGGPFRGAMRGRMIGEAAGNPGAGMMGGGMAGMIRRRMEKGRQETQQESPQRGNTNAHDRAFKACMEGRGYTVE